MITLLSVCSVFCVIISITSAQNQCRTPDNRNGNCIAMQQCRPLLKLVRTDITTEQRTFLRSSQCGRDGDKILVCCPNKFTVDDLPSSQYCGKQVGNKLAGDGETSIYELPWMALLHYKKQEGAGGSGRREGFFCGGSLIHDKYVITAAHCVSGLIIQQRFIVDFVRLGEHNLQSNPDCSQQNRCADPVEDVPIAEIIVHENYKPSRNTEGNDIALIRLERVVPYTDFIRPICLPVGKLQNRNYDGQPVVAAGFGKTDEASLSVVKLKLGLNGVNFKQCVDIYRTAGVNLGNVTQLCAGGEEGKDTCNGDAGGPVLAEEIGNESSNQDPFSYLIGIISFGPKVCGTAGFPSVNTRVDQYIDWILDNMKK